MNVISMRRLIVKENDIIESNAIVAAAVEHQLRRRNCNSIIITDAIDT